ncbi:MAG: DUF3365 domain-containing protein [Magnetococcales bacterium]|nr:DUF3365 domain-containing protein [Magnetococcales bacterium]
MYISTESNKQLWRETRRAMIAVTILWTAIIACSISWKTYDEKRHTIALATNTARENFNKDMVFRYWGSSHGGVYVPTTSRTPSSPYLAHLPERDIITPSGRKLTLMNPAYMLRQIMNEYPGLYGVQARITSLKPLNPVNTPDPWEKEQLLAFEKNRFSEALAIIDYNGEPTLRLMRPLKVQEGCQKCHEHQDYQVNDIRGGIGVTVPMTPYLAHEQQSIRSMFWSHGALWMVGLIGIGFHANGQYQRQKERKKTDDTLRKLARIVAVSGDHMSFIDQDYTYVAVNDAYLKIHKKSRNEIEGKRIDELMGEKTFITIKPFLDRCLSGEKVGYQAWFTFPDHNPQWMDVQYHPFYELDGSISGIVVTSRELTQLKMVEEDLIKAKNLAEAANQAKSEFLAVMSHEIRTPLNAILGMTEVCLENNTEPDQASYLAIIERSGKNLLALIEDILNLSHIESGRLTLEHKQLNIRTLANEAVGIHFHKAKSQNVALSYTISDQVTESFLGDNTRLRQILLNLIGNAVKFTDNGQVELLITQPTPETLLFSVSDSGIGISKEKQQIIFNPFSQADSSNTRKHGGVGLGLSICKRLVEAMHGKIWVESVPGKGSTFYVSLPLTTQNHPPL